MSNKRIEKKKQDKINGIYVGYQILYEISKGRLKTKAKAKDYYGFWNIVPMDLRRKIYNALRKLK